MSIDCFTNRSVTPSNGVCLPVTWPMQHPPPRREQKEPAMWDAETVGLFMDAAKNSRFHHLYHLAVLTGMRRSELAGLKWENVDLLSGRLSIVNTLQRIPGYGLVESTPKTARSRRNIALKAVAVKSLHSIRGRQIEEREVAGTAWQNTDYVFAQADGTPVDPESITRDFRAIVDRSGLPYLTLNGLRHAHATLALAAGVNPKIVSERLGHSTIAITMDTYSHVLPGMQEEAAQAVEDLLEEAEYRRLERNLIGRNGHELFGIRQHQRGRRAAPRYKCPDPITPSQIRRDWLAQRQYNSKTGGGNPVPVLLLPYSILAWCLSSSRATG